MAQFRVNIPNQKVQTFLTSMAQFGFTKSIQQLQSTQVTQQQILQHQTNKNCQTNHPYYDWDFYNNDLLID